MTIGTLIEKLENNSITLEELKLLQEKSTRMFSNISKATLIKFHDDYHNVPMEERSWEDFSAKQAKVLAECLGCEMLIPDDIRKENGLAIFTKETEFESI